MKTETLAFDTPNGATTAYTAAPDEINESTKAVILIHEWWGLNDHIKKIAERYAGEGFIAVAPDLYRGKLAADPDEAAKLMADLAIDDGLETIKSAMAKARESFGVPNFGISGYCMGGTFALEAACRVEGLKAAAPYYGDIPSEDVLKGLEIPVVFVSGTKDAWINPAKVSELTGAAEKYDLSVESLVYEADHAFSNSSRPEVYDKDAAEDAWAKVIKFFNENL
ncbi:MAG: dienelactone hydrolase family protein [Pyrinomonadaceae bacterium]|nr:dienelactone hydrolase family protein [Pyrinomonadaceae bacterium]